MVAIGCRINCVRESVEFGESMGSLLAEPEYVGQYGKACTFCAID